MIPRILHRIWLDDPDDPGMPGEFAEYGARWRELHPDWHWLEWRSHEYLPPLHNETEFQLAREIIPHDWRRFQSDLLRLELLWRFGGVYVDCDVEPLRTIDHLRDHPAFAGWSPNRGPTGQRIITQAVLGAHAGNGFIASCISGLPAAVREYGDRSLAQMIGPWHITRTWQVTEGRDVEILPEHVFYPQANTERDAGHEPTLHPETVAWHRWANTRDGRYPTHGRRR